MWYVYILQCNDNTLYTGSTTDPDRRVDEHNNKKGASYISMRLPVKVVYIEEQPDRSRAQKREAEINPKSKNNWVIFYKLLKKKNCQLIALGSDELKEKILYRKEEEIINVSDIKKNLITRNLEKLLYLFFDYEKLIINKIKSEIKKEGITGILTRDIYSEKIIETLKKNNIKIIIPNVRLFKSRSQKEDPSAEEIVRKFMKIRKTIYEEMAKNKKKKGKIKYIPSN